MAHGLSRGDCERPHSPHLRYRPFGRLPPWGTLSDTMLELDDSFALKRESDLTVYELRHYVTEDGRDPVQEWLDGLRNARTHTALLRRLDRVASGNFGDHGFCREGVWELRIDMGPGYRVYYALHGRAIIILLCGGDKRKQQRDIAQAVQYWRELQQRDA